MHSRIKCYGLIGYPLTHSFSASFFSEKFKREAITGCSYQNYPIEHIGLLPKIITENGNLVGLNVTIPYKQQVIPYLDQVDAEIAAIGAVNTIKIIRKEGKISLLGFNTDAYGFGTSLKPLLKKHYSSALILGTGGASKAAVFVLNHLGFNVTFVSRRPKELNHISYDQVTAEVIGKNRVIINTSPVGMYPDINSCPALPYEFLTPDHVLFDMVYNPPETCFMAMGRKMGASVINGLQMLHLQAEKAWEIWNTDL
jgi:shikimate dehydrogenase